MNRSPFHLKTEMNSCTIRLMKYIWQRDDWPSFRWADALLLDDLTRLAVDRGRLFASLEPLSLDERVALSTGALIADTESTSVIEGIVLTPASVRSSVAHRLGLPTAGLPARRRAVDGLVNVLLDATQDPERPLTSERLKGWHAALFPTGRSGFNRITVGDWRPGSISIQSGPHGRETIHFEGPPTEAIERELERFLDWWTDSADTTNGVLRAGIAHLWFETIHPFDDGNGRIGRAVADLALAQADGASQRYYSLSRAIFDDRSSYYRELKAAQQGDLDVTSWLRWFIGCLSNAVQHSQAQLTAALRRANLRRHAASEGLDPRQLKVLHKLIDAEPDGFDGGLSNSNYRAITKVSRATAARQLADLLGRGLLLKSDAGGRSTRYHLNKARLTEGH